MRSLKGCSDEWVIQIRISELGSSNFRKENEAGMLPYSQRRSNIESGS